MNFIHARHWLICVVLTAAVYEVLDVRVLNSLHRVRGASGKVLGSFLVHVGQLLLSVRRIDSS